MTKMVPIRFPEKLLEELDEFRKGRYGTRSAAVRDAVRKLIEKEET